MLSVSKNNGCRKWAGPCNSLCDLTPVTNAFWASLRHSGGQGGSPIGGCFPLIPTPTVNRAVPRDTPPWPWGSLRAAPRTRAEDITNPRLHSAQTGPSYFQEGPMCTIGSRAPSDTRLFSVPEMEAAVQKSPGSSDGSRPFLGVPRMTRPHCPGVCGKPGPVLVWQSRPLAAVRISQWPRGRASGWQN